MARSPLLTRLLSPAGFGLVLMLLLLPFLAVACDVTTPDERLSFSATFTGWDLVVGGSPTVRSTVEDERLTEAGEPIDAEPFAIATVVVLVAGAAAALLRSPLARITAGAGTGVLGAALLFATEVQARSTVQDLVRTQLGDLGPGLSPADLVRTRYGFWLALLAVLGVALGNAIALSRALRPVDELSDAPPPAGLSLLDDEPQQ
ncbi:MAG: hypothetical protein ACM30G_00620 [Micromonosporaceae bacterium]